MHSAAPDQVAALQHAGTGARQQALAHRSQVRTQCIDDTEIMQIDTGHGVPLSGGTGSIFTETFSGGISIMSMAWDSGPALLSICAMGCPCSEMSRISPAAVELMVMSRPCSRGLISAGSARASCSMTTS